MLTYKDSARAQAADRALDAAWSALYDWLTGWSKLPRSSQAKIAAPILADIYPEGLRFILLAYKLQWAESAARLDKLKKAHHDDSIKELGGEPFLKTLPLRWAGVMTPRCPVIASLGRRSRVLRPCLVFTTANPCPPRFLFSLRHRGITTTFEATFPSLWPGRDLLPCP